MDAQSVVDLAREAVLLALWIGAPVLIAGMVVGLLIGLLQALTQIQEQSISFVPKLVVMVLVLVLTLPWLIGQWTDYTADLFHRIPEALSR